jgi:hypothetical protein
MISQGPQGPSSFLSNRFQRTSGRVPTLRGRFTRPARDVGQITPRKLLIYLRNLWGADVFQLHHSYINVSS